MIEAFDCNQQLEQWFAVRVKSNRENIVVTSLSGKGYQTFLPTFQVVTQSKTALDRPLFPGYVFCRFHVNRRLPILMLPGVVHIVGIGRTPLPIDDGEVASLRVAVESRLPVAPVDYTTGEQVRIDNGPLSGAVGVVSGRKNDRLIVSITLLQRSVAVELQTDWLTRAHSAGDGYRGELHAHQSD